VKNICYLFETKQGIHILKGNIGDFIEYKVSAITNFNDELMRNQLLEIASNAWMTNDYVVFIESIEKIGINKIPKSYLLKYQIAKQKI